MAYQEKQFNFYRLVALFLAEIIRSRRTSIARAAEIAHLVVQKLPQVNTEEEVLLMLTVIEKDFEEISVLRQALHFGYTKTDTRVYEQEIKQYAADIFVDDMVLSANFLQDAAKQGANIQELCLKYPQFCNYLSRASRKAGVLPELSAAMG